MPGSAKKYRTVHAFGRRKRKGRGRKAAKSSEPLVDSEERCVDAPRPFSSGATERVASDSDDGRTSAAADSGRLRVDAKVLTDAEENGAREKATFERLHWHWQQRGTSILSRDLQRGIDARLGPRRPLLSYAPRCVELDNGRRVL